MSDLTAAAAIRKPSLRSRVALHVIVPLALTWMVGTGMTLSVANYFVQQSFDRALLDDAYSLAANVKGEGATLSLLLSPAEIKHVLFDQTEAIYFAVLRPDGTLVAGHPGLRLPPERSVATHEFADQIYQGQNLRAVTLRHVAPEFRVVLAQTQQTRELMLQRLLAYSVVPQVLLLMLLGFWLRAAIKSDLAPLGRLQQAVDRRPAHDFTHFESDASTRDIQRLTQGLNAMLGRIQTSVQAQREFAGNVAHELRTPLAGIRALAQYGLAQHDPQVWAQQLRSVQDSEARASHMVDQLLALALADETGAGLKVERLQLDELVRDAVLRYLPRADTAGVDLGARGIDAPVELWANPTLVEGMLNNLLDNALRYGRPADGQAARVTAELAWAQHNEGECLHLSVIDNGPGINALQQRTLTQRWVRGSAGERVAQGAGLGLAIVSQYARSLHAEFKLLPGEQGRGLCARIVFNRPRDAGSSP